MKIHKVNVFTKTPYEGYPAVIVEEFIGDKVAMQALAKELHAPITVFILAPSEGIKANVALLFFTTTRELLLCGHGSLAAASYLLARKWQGSVVLEIPQNKLLTVYKNIEGIFQFKSSLATELNIPLKNEEVYDMLNIKDPEVIDQSLPYSCATIGSAKLLVPIKTKNDVLSLKPRFDLIEKWSKENGVNGIYVYTTDTSNSATTFYARSFNPVSGHNEEAANSLAAAVLASQFLQKKEVLFPIVVEQGHHMKMRCRIMISFIDGYLMIGGHARHAPTRVFKNIVRDVQEQKIQAKL